MATKRESTGYPDSDLLDYDDLADPWGLLEFDDMDAPEEDVFRPARTRAGAHQATGRRDSSRQEPAKRRPAASRPAPEPTRRRAAAKELTPEPVKRRAKASKPEPETEQTPPVRNGNHRHPVSKRRRRRKIVALVVLLVLAGAAYVAANIVVGRVKGFQVASASADQQVLSWEKSRGADGYAIYDGSGTLLAEVGADKDARYTVEGLRGGTRYAYTIVGVKNFLGKHSGKAAECSAYTLPETVDELTAMNSGTGALLTWADSGAGGYEVQYTDGYSPAQTLEVKAGDAGELSIPDLQEGAQYTFQIRSFIQDGESRVYSDWSAAAPITAVHTADMTGVDVDRPMVALTFDDGPDYGDVTDRILATLKEYDAHASFFQEGGSASNLPELMNRIADAGHEIACHTYDHSHYGSDVTADDIVLADDAIEQAIGKRPTAFRSPGGETTDLIRDVCVSEKMPIFYWSIDTEDWKSRNADSVCDIVMNNVSDGDIILMHNVYDSTADAVERIVPFLAEKGYQMVTVSQLVQAKTGKPPVPGTQYITATQTN